MNDKEIIARKIISDATEQAAFLRAEAAKRVEQSVESERQAAQKTVQDACQEAQKEGELALERKTTIARLDGKKVILGAKRKLVNDCFAHAVALLQSMPKAEYLSFVCKQLEKYAERGDVVYLDKNAPFSTDELAALPLFAERGLTAMQGEDFGGGVKLVGAKMDTNLSFPTVVARAESEYTQDVVSMLFK